MGEADPRWRDARGVRADPGESAQCLVDGEKRPHFLGDPGRVLRAEDGLPFAHAGLVAPDDGLAAPALRIAAGQVRRRVLLRVEQVGDQAEYLRRGCLSAGSGRGVHGVLDDADGDDGTVLLPGRLHLREVGAVCQHFHRLEGERRRRAPQDVRPGRQHVAGQGPGQEVAVREDDHPGAEAFQQVKRQGLLAGGVRAERGAQQAPGPGLGRGHPPDLRERPVARLAGGTPEVLVVGLAVRHTGFAGV